MKKKTTQQKPTLLIDRRKFVDWYYDDDMLETFTRDNSVLFSLYSSGVFTLTLDSLLDGVGYLPSHVAKSGQKLFLDEDGEVDMSAYGKIVFEPIKKIESKK